MSIEKYKNYIENSIKKYCADDAFLLYFEKVPKDRYYTFSLCLEKLEENTTNDLVIVELGTTRSFVDGLYEGSNSNNIAYWNADNPEKWDWSAGLFTYIFAEYLNDKYKGVLHTVDIIQEHIERCKLITSKFRENIKYHVSSSENFLSSFGGKIDLLYLDTGDMTPIEPTAELHLREAKIIVERNMLGDNGYILIDDVRNITPKKYGELSNFGKAKYSIPYFLDNGYQFVADEYQVILKKNNIPKWLSQKTNNEKKVLHISFHSGCKNELDYVFDKLGYCIEFMNFDDGKTTTNAKYNIGYRRANWCWKKYKNYFETFDLIITSDTAPISRVFLQNKFSKKILIWICNRFDYSDCASLDCEFPDLEYYKLFKRALLKNNVFIAGYTKFENYYCKNIRDIDIGNNVIKPTGKNKEITIDYSDNDKNYSDTFFIPPYHNDTIMMNLSEKLTELGIKNYNNRYNGMKELKMFKGVVHIPYAWSNFALFEAIQFGIIYFIPSKTFLFEIKKNKDFFWSPPYNDNWIELSEWYCEENKNLFVYFDSWEDLANKVVTINYKEKKEQIIQFAYEHEKKQIQLWKNAIDILQF